MIKVILLGASWCPVTNETKELFERLKKEDSNFDYEYADIDSGGGKLLVKNLSVTDVPKTIFQGKIIFHGLPGKEKLLEFIKGGSIQQPTKKEQKFLRRRQKEREQKTARQRRSIKKVLGKGLIVLIIAGAVVVLIWYLASRPSLPESEIISKNGIHWHPELSIKILGQEIEIPANIGLGVVEQPLHTHDNMGVIHLEFSGSVRKDDVRLGQFFEIWGKSFNKDCIFDKCSGRDGKVKMLVNGELNSEFENYTMKDGDKIEIIFE